MMEAKTAVPIPPAVRAAIAAAPPTPALVYAPPTSSPTIAEDVMARLLIDGLLGRRVVPHDPYEAAYAEQLWAELDHLPSRAGVVDVPPSIPDVPLTNSF